MKCKDSIIYPNVPSVTKAACERNDSIPEISAKREAEEINADENQTLEYKPTRNLPVLLNQKELNDLISDPNFSKNEAEILDSRLKEKSLLKKDMKTSYRNRERDLTTFFPVKILSFIVST